MIKKLVLILTVLFICSAFATAIEVTPIQKIKSTTKHFSVGNKYKFKDVQTGEIYTGEVTFYRPNGMTGQEAQTEISNFVNSHGEKISGKITLIPSNHKVYQEFANYFESSCFVFIRGSEVILKPNVNKFIIGQPETDKISYFIKLLPAEPVSTIHDELEIGDIIRFKTAEDVYKNGKLFIKKDTPVFGKIDIFDENGWIGDNAEIKIKKFVTTDISGKITELNSDLSINGFELLKYKSKRLAQFFNYMTVIFRGKEIDIKPYDKNICFVIVITE